MKFKCLLILLSFLFILGSCDKEDNLGINEKQEIKSSKEELDLSNLKLDLSKMSFNFDGVLLESFSAATRTEKTIAIISVLNELENIKDSNSGDAVSVNLGVLNNKLVVSSFGIYKGEKLILDFDNPEFTPNIGGPAPPNLIASCPKGTTELESCMSSDCVSETAQEYLSANLDSAGDCAAVFVSLGTFSAAVCGKTC